ncbi:MAG TPA: gliding motility lipoprotein GldH [Bacteroidales bacterium]|jgi:gliding motility-associated lipoprotein GldH|nr:gliding motility lipoprotein GldH [Bacteroidales bacterium]
MIKEITKISFPLLVLLFLLNACKSNLIYTDSVTMPEKTWDLSNIVNFSAPVTDTTITSDIYFTIRTGSDYPFRNIFLFVTTLSPDGKTMTDTLEYYLADEKGNWFGKGSGDVHELDLPFRSNIYFPLKGNYDFKIRHGMRTDGLKGIYDFGIRIRKFKR